MLSAMILFFISAMANYQGVILSRNIIGEALYQVIHLLHYGQILNPLMNCRNILILVPVIYIIQIIHRSWLPIQVLTWMRISTTPKMDSKNTTITAVSG